MPTGFEKPGNRVMLNLSNSNMAVDMELFVGNLSPHAREVDIHQFFKSYSKQLKVSLKKTRQVNTTYYYAIVDMGPERQALKAIKKLNHNKLNGKPVQIREYQYRAGNNDRRALNWRSLPWNDLERRQTERRFRSKITTPSSPRFLGYDNLATKGS